MFSSEGWSPSNTRPLADADVSKDMENVDNTVWQQGNKEGLSVECVNIFLVYGVNVDRYNTR